MTQDDLPTVLLVEDNDGHARLILNELEGHGLAGRTLRFADGQEAWDYLSGTGERKLEQGIPCIMLLDLNMPRMDGFGLLGLMKSHPGLRRVPVIILTSSDNPREIRKAHEMGCSAFVTKPVGFSELKETLGRLAKFILSMSVPPAYDAGKDR